MSKPQIWFAFVLLVAILAATIFGQLRTPSYEYRLEFYPDVAAMNRDSDGWQIVSARLARDSREQWGYEAILARRR